MASSGAGPISIFLQLHERLIITIIVLAAVCLGVAKGVDYLRLRDQLAFNKSEVVLQAQIEANKNISVSAVQALQQYQALVTELTASNKSITAARVERDRQAQWQQELDKAISLPMVAYRLSAALQIDPKSVADVRDGIHLTPDAAHTALAALDAIPQLQADLAGEQALVANDAKQISSLTSVATVLQSQVDGLNAQVTDQSKACKDEVNLEKAKARKSKLRWLGVGFIAGLIAGRFI